MTNENHYISNIRVPIATKLHRMVTYLKRPLLIKLLDLLMDDVTPLWYDVTYNG